VSIIKCLYVVTITLIIISFHRFKGSPFRVAMLTQVFSVEGNPEPVYPNPDKPELTNEE
jgi:hypothetical protein